MKKISLIISFVVLFSLAGNAQVDNLRIGFKIGPSLDWASSGSIETENKGVGLGLNMGLVLDYYFTGNLAVSSGLNFDLFSMKYNFTDYRRPEDFLEESNVMVRRRVKGSNLEIPIMLKGKYNIANLFDAYIEAGCGLGFNLKDRCKDEFDFYWTHYADERYVDCTNQYRAFQPSLLFGVGVEYEINEKLDAFVQLSFNHAFANAFVKSLERQTGSIIRNNYIGIEFGVMY